MVKLQGVKDLMEDPERDPESNSTITHQMLQEQVVLLLEDLVPPEEAAPAAVREAVQEAQLFSHRVCNLFSI
jgi:hypothetical protein